MSNIQRETVTYATITLQNYFRMYSKLAGMTGTAATEAEEFWKIYKLDVAEIPTNLPMVREDRTDLIYRDEKAKYEAVVSEIEERQRAGQPVLVGTTDISKSELLSETMDRKGIRHEVLNAKQHERGGRHHRRGRTDRRRNRRHEYGGPWHRHRPRWESRRPRHQSGTVGGRPQEGGGTGRASYRRYGTPRGATDRQPAPWPCGPARRPRKLPVLRGPRRRPDAPVRGRQDQDRDGMGRARGTTPPSRTGW